MVFLILVCSKCGSLLLAKNDQKTRTCPYCSFKVPVERAKKIASASSANEASILLRRLKKNKASKYV